MNFFISNLRINFLLIPSPFLSQLKYINLYNSNFKYSYNNFYYNILNLKNSKIIFQNFLNNILKINNNIYNERLILNNNLNISNSIIQNIYSINEKGGAIFVNNSINLIIKNTIFKKCYSYSEGGAIYFNGNQIFISNSCFVECGCSFQYNNFGGNCLTSYGNYSNLENLFSFYCSDNEIKGDSSFIFRNNFTIFKFINCSYCKGYEGACGFSNYNTSNYSIYSYLNFEFSNDFTVIESLISSIFVYNSNIINNSLITLVNQRSNINLFFLNIYKNSFFRINTTTGTYGLLLMNNCKSDFEYDGSILINSITSFIFTKISLQYCLNRFSIEFLKSFNSKFVFKLIFLISFLK